MQLDGHNIDYRIVDVKPEQDAVQEAVLNAVKNAGVDGIISLWGEITSKLASVITQQNLKPLRAGKFGCSDFEKFVRDGSLDLLMKVVTQLGGGIPLENLHYSSTYGVIPSTVSLHAKPVTEIK